MCSRKELADAQEIIFPSSADIINSVQPLLLILFVGPSVVKHAVHSQFLCGELNKRTKGRKEAGLIVHGVVVLIILGQPCG